MQLLCSKSAKTHLHESINFKIFWSPLNVPIITGGKGRKRKERGIDGGRRDRHAGRRGGTGRRVGKRIA